MNPLDGGGGGNEGQPETTVQSPAQNMTTVQNTQQQGVHNAQTVVQSGMQSLQPAVVGTIGASSGLVGKSVSLDLNPKLPSMKPPAQPGVASTDANKITTTLCSVGSTVRIISPGMLSAVERQNQPQQLVTATPATYHVPRGPAAVANISAPRSTVATPIVRAMATGQPPIPNSRPGPNTTVSNTQWQPKTTSVVYAQPQRHPVPPISRVTTRLPTPIYTGQQPRLVTPAQGRPPQATMVGGVSGASARLVAPVLQPTGSVARIPVVQNRSPNPQVSGITPLSQTGRPPQTLQSNQTGRPLRAAGPPRVVQSVTCLSTVGTVPRVITTTANASGLSRVNQQASTSVARITGNVVSLHPLPLAPARVTPSPIKTTQQQNVAQSVQLKPPVQQAGLRVSMSTSNSGTCATISQPVQGQYLHAPQTTTTTATTTTTTTTPVTATNAPSTTTTTTYYSFETSGAYSQYRPASVQPVRLLVEPGYEEPHIKPNASPRPSILRKRDHDSSPAKGAAKNLVPVLASLPPAVSASSPPGSPRGDRDTGGCQSSGSTTVSATSSPGPDEEPEQQSRITINPTVEMSPRKKPRKQQLTGVELTEPRCTEEEMQFITEERIKKEIKEETKEKSHYERKHNLIMQQNVKTMVQQSIPAPVRTKPTPSLLGSSWKNRWGGRLHHYRRPSDVKSREERRPTVAELAQQKHVLQKLNGWKVYHLTAQMEDLAELEKQVHEKLKTTLSMLESQQSGRGRQDEGLERANELIKGNMQRSSLISEGMNEARTQLVAIFQHKGHVTDILQRCGNKRAQKKRDK